MKFQAQMCGGGTFTGFHLVDTPSSPPESKYPAHKTWHNSPCMSALAPPSTPPERAHTGVSSSVWARHCTCRVAQKKIGYHPMPSLGFVNKWRFVSRPGPEPATGGVGAEPFGNQHPWGVSCHPGNLGAPHPRACPGCTPCMVMG